MRPSDLFHWHRRIGLFVIIWLIVVASSGLLLNHSSELGLADYETPWTMPSFRPGSDKGAAPVVYTAGGRRLAWRDGRILLQGRVLSSGEARLQGAVVVDGVLVVASESAIWLIDDDGEIVDRIEAPVGGTIGRVGHIEGRPVVEIEDGRRYRIGADWLEWRPLREGEPVWAHRDTASGMAQKPIDTEARRLDLERLVLAIHRGSILHPRWGPYLLDTVAIGMLWLACSGLWIWWGRRRRRRGCDRRGRS